LKDIHAICEEPSEHSLRTKSVNYVRKETTKKTIKEKESGDPNDDFLSNEYQRQYGSTPERKSFFRSPIKFQKDSETPKDVT